MIGIELVFLCIVVFVLFLNAMIHDGIRDFGNNHRMRK